MRARWPQGESVEVVESVEGEEGESVEVVKGTERLGRAPPPFVRVTYACPGGEAAGRAQLSAEEQARLRHVFAKPDARLHVRGSEAPAGASAASTGIGPR